MRKNMTELVMIIDKSGSMAGYERDMIKGFNAMLKEQTRSGSSLLVSAVLFNENSDMTFDRLPLTDTPKMTRRDYRTGGSTALLDTLGEAIGYIYNRHRELSDEERPEKTVFAIVTDGMDNASREYSCGQIRKMIERLTHVFDWEFIFLGASIDAMELPGKLGIPADHAANCHCEQKGTRLGFEVLGMAIRRIRESSLPLDASWKTEIDRHYRAAGGGWR